MLRRFLSTARLRTLSDRDSERPPEYSRTDPLGVAGASQVATPNYIYYRIYAAEDEGIPSKTPVARGDPFLGRIKAISVPPPRIVKTVKCSIATVENITDGESTSLFLTPYSESPLDDAEKVIVLNGTGPGSTPHEPLALVVKMSESERSALKSKRRGKLVAKPDTTVTPSEIRYVYYMLYANNYEMPSKAAFDPEQPCLGRIRADSVAPPHSPTSIKRYISRVEGSPVLVRAGLFADTSCDTPLKEEGHIPFLRTDGPGLSPNEPMAIVQVKNPSIPDGYYVIKNRLKNIYWVSDGYPFCKVYFRSSAMNYAKKCKEYQWYITKDSNGDISLRSRDDPFSWVGADMAGYTLPVSWRLIPVDRDSKSYYLTTDMNNFSQNPQVPVVHWQNRSKNGEVPGTMASLKEGDQWQMWEFIHM